MIAIEHPMHSVGEERDKAADVQQRHRGMDRSRHQMAPVGGIALSGPTTVVFIPAGGVTEGAIPDACWAAATCVSEAGSVDCWKGLSSGAAGPAGGSTGPVAGRACGTGSAGTGMLVSVFQSPEKVWVTSVCTAVVTSGSTA
eukprot:360716-Amphidinium_carterae.2